MIRSLVSSMAIGPRPVVKSIALTLVSSVLPSPIPLPAEMTSSAFSATTSMALSPASNTPPLVLVIVKSAAPVVVRLLMVISLVADSAITPLAAFALVPSAMVMAPDVAVRVTSPLPEATVILLLTFTSPVAATSEMSPFARESRS